MEGDLNLLLERIYLPKHLKNNKKGDPTMNTRQIKRLLRSIASSEMDLEIADCLATNPEYKREARILRKLAKKRRRKIRRREDLLMCKDYGYN